MLILSRRTDESIVIGDEVTITILSVKGKQVRIGIDAPPNVSVHREEIYKKIRDGEHPEGHEPPAESDETATSADGESAAVEDARDG